MYEILENAFHTIVMYSCLLLEGIGIAIILYMAIRSLVLLIRGRKGVGMGLAKARDAMGEDWSVVSVIGDGSMTGGMVFEALDHSRRPSAAAGGGHHRRAACDPDRSDPLGDQDREG